MADNTTSTPTASAEDLLVQILKDNQVWADLTEAFNAVVALNVDDQITQLERIRFIMQDTDQSILQATARMLGFDASQDVLNMNSDSLTRLVSQLPRYPDQNSTQYFTNFIDVLLNSSIKVDYLYSKDYVNFLTVPQGPLITDATLSDGLTPSGAMGAGGGSGGAGGGSGPAQWFKTTHINLNIALLNLQTLVLRPNQTLLARTKELFYSYSPIPLVIERITFALSMGELTIGFAIKQIGYDKYAILE